MSAAAPSVAILDAPRPAINPWIVAPIVAIAAFMEVLDTTIVNVALPHIAGSMSTTIDQSTWVLTSYLLANAIVLPLNGFMVSVFGRKRYFMGCMAVFTVSSLLCGLAPSYPILLVMRVIQGLGGGGLQPGAQSIMRDSFPLKRIGTAMAVYGIVVVVGPVLGPLLGGFITDNASWRWCFFINVPIGIVTLMLLQVVLHDPPGMKRIDLRHSGIDFVGLGLLAIGLAALQIMLDRGEDADWFSSNFICGLAIAAVLGLALFIVWEWFHKHPIVNLRLLENRNFGFATLGMLLFGMVLYSTTTLLPLLSQTLIGYDAQTAGWVLAPGGMVVFCMMPLVGFLVPRVATRWLVTFGVLVNVFALVLMGRLSLETDFHHLAWCRTVQGLGLAFLFVPFNTAAFAYLSSDQLSSAAGIINLTRNIGGSIGIALAEVFIRRVSQQHQAFLAANATTLNPAYNQQMSALQAAMVHAGISPADAANNAHAVIYNTIISHAGMLAYVDAFHLLAWMFLLVIPVALVLKTPNFKGKSRPIAVE